MRGWSSHDGTFSGSEAGEENDEDEESRAWVDLKSKEVHVFCVSIDVRSFKANMHLPMRSANVFLRVMLPPEIVRLAVESCNTSSKVTAPLRTHPPVLVSRGTEVNISNGWSSRIHRAVSCVWGFTSCKADARVGPEFKEFFSLPRFCTCKVKRCKSESRDAHARPAPAYVALELPASAHGMAAMLALHPEVVAHILHRDIYAADSVLGVASIPMKRLMKFPLVDGYSHVQGASNIEGKIEDVKIGSLRVVLAINDLGPVKGLDTTKLRIGSSPGRLLHMDDTSTTNLKSGSIFSPRGPSQSGRKELESGVKELESDNIEEVRVHEMAQDELSSGFENSHKGKQTKAKSSKMKSTFSKAYITSKLKEDGRVECPEETGRNRPEYELAWEFEMWRRTEEANWRADLKEKEIKRLNDLEDEWRKQEKKHTIDIRNSQTEQADLEAKLRAKLFNLEKRERAINLAEEEITHRKEALERAYASRSSDAQVAVKRLQAECEHRVELEHAKYAALQEQHTLLEQRLAICNSSLATVEKQFQEFKAAQRGTSEAELVGQIIALKQTCSNLQRNAELAIDARNDYRTQVLKMAKELAKLHRERSEAETYRVLRERSQLDSQAVAALIESQSQRAREDRLELQRLKDQLELLQMHEQEALTTNAIQHDVLGNSPRNLERIAQNLMSSPLKGTEVPRLDLSKLARSKDQDGRGQALKGPGLGSWPRKPLVEVGQRQKEAGNMKGKRPCVETRYHELGLLDVENEDHTLYEPESSSNATRSKIGYLLKQRADLLKTGVYSMSDRVIRGLDQEIQQLQSGFGLLKPYENPTMSP